MRTDHIEQIRVGYTTIHWVLATDDLDSVRLLALSFTLSGDTIDSDEGSRRRQPALR